MNKENITKIRNEIILAALPHITFDGWSEETLTHAATQSGHSTNTLRAVFPQIKKDALDGFAALADQHMLNALPNTPTENTRIRDRIKDALMARYQFLSPYKEALRQSAQFWINPSQKPRAAKTIWRTADKIWTWAESQTERQTPRKPKDYNHYTKRTLLSGIIISSTLYWLNDNNEQNQDKLEAFIDRRIENVMQLNKMTGKLKKAAP